MAYRALLLASALALTVHAAPSFADDEGSEHTAVLIGAPDDAIGVTVQFDDHDGWSLSVIDPHSHVEHSHTVALGKQHAHYVAYIAPGRVSVTFVEISRGDAPAAADPLATVWSSDGKLLRTWSYEQVLTPAERGSLRRSVSHFGWTESYGLGLKGLELHVVSSKRTVVLAPDAASLHGRR